MRWSIKKSCKWASKIISVSENTKKDLIDLYNISEDKKIEVINNGYDSDFGSRYLRENGYFNIPSTKLEVKEVKYFLFIGRIEERKNVVNIIKAFNEVKKNYKLLHKLVLVGGSGYGFENVEKEIGESDFRKDIILTGYVSDKEKWRLLKDADIFLYPTLYEGFGIPILEAQSASVPVVAGKNSSISEVAQSSAYLVSAENSLDIAGAIWRIINDKNMRVGIIEKGHKNTKRFSWKDCAAKIKNVIA